MSNFRYLDYEGLSTYTKHIKSYADGKIVYLSDESEIPDPPKEGTLYVIGSEILMDEEIIIGTQTANTSSWTGQSIDTRLHDGKRIAYYLPYPSVAGTPPTLTLILNDEVNTPTSAIRIISEGRYFNDVIPGGSVIRMTYFENVMMNGTRFGGWICDGNVIQNNVTGTGINNCIAVFNGNNTITNGPSLGTATDTYLRNDGRWIAPSECQICDYGNLFGDGVSTAILPSNLKLSGNIKFVNGGRLLVKFNDNLGATSGTIVDLYLPDGNMITLTTNANTSTGYKEYHRGVHILDIVMVELDSTTKYGYTNTFSLNVATTTTNGLMSNRDKSKLDTLNYTTYCTCPTSASVVAKVATATTTGFVLATGSVAYISFEHTNTVAAPTLNIGGTGAKYIKYNGVVYDRNNANGMRPSWNANGVYHFVYDGSNWVVVGDMPIASTTIS